MSKRRMACALLALSLFVLALAQAAPRLLTRGVLYTAVTRARELLIAVGGEETAHRMIDNHVQSRRYSGLRLRLSSEK